MAYPIVGTDTTGFFFIVIGALPNAEFAATVNTALTVAFLSIMLNPGAVKSDTQKITPKSTDLYYDFHNL